MSRRKSLCYENNSPPSLKPFALGTAHKVQGNYIFLLQNYVARSMAGSWNAACGSLVDVDITELSESPWPGIDIFCTSMGLGRQILKELDLKQTLGMAERR